MPRQPASSTGQSPSSRPRDHVAIVTSDDAYRGGVTNQPTRYLSGDENSARWLDFDFRDDIVISTRSKSGTTWVQMICALLIFQTPDLPRSLPELSPWLDWLVLPKDELLADLDTQTHRRFIKTYTPLDGLPRDDRVTFIVVARHPLDASASLYHQSHNINRQRIAELTGNPDLAKPRKLPPLDEWLLIWIESDATARDQLESFTGVFHHLTDAWSRKDRPNVMLVHYADLLHDLAREMTRIAACLGIDVASELTTWHGLQRSSRCKSTETSLHPTLREPSWTKPLLPFRPIWCRHGRVEFRRHRCLPLAGISSGVAGPPRMAASRLAGAAQDSLRPPVQAQRMERDIPHDCDRSPQEIVGCVPADGSSAESRLPRTAATSATRASTKLTKVAESADCQINSARSEPSSSTISLIKVAVLTYVITDAARKRDRLHFPSA